MKTPVAIQRHIVRLICEHFASNRQVAQQLRISHNTVRVVRDQLELKSQTWETLRHLNDSDFAKALGTVPNSIEMRKPQPDWQYVHQELSQPDVTLDTLWHEFRREQPDGISYPQMTKLYKKWTRTLAVSMRHVHQAGDVLFVDFCGRTMPVIDPDTGVVSNYQVFVGVLGGSGYIFAYAVPSQQVADWIKCHVKAFEHFGGVPMRVITDNLKSAVLKNKRPSITLNKVYQELAEHYSFAILPARPRKPKDKPLAEVSVKIVQISALARLRKQKFFSADELNKAITNLVDEINEKTTKKFPKSRTERFLDIDASALQDLPATRYEAKAWQHNIRIDEFYQVTWEGGRYSVPYQYCHQLVDLRLVDNVLEIFHQRQRIASHVLAGANANVILDEHMPAHHLYQRYNTPEALLIWSASIGTSTHEYVKRNLNDRSDYANALKTVQYLRGWAREGDNHLRVEAICSYAISLNMLSRNRLESIIRTHAELKANQTKPNKPAIAHKNLRGADYFAKSGVHAL